MNQPGDNRLNAKWINLAEERLETEVLFATDDFFAEKENLIKSGRGVFIEDKYTDRGKWMDGWESRRKRTTGHDFAILKLGLQGRIRGVDIDTNHFLGNHPPHASIDACLSPTSPNSDTLWAEVLPKSELQPGSQNLFDISCEQSFNHVRLHIYPDGGVARLRIYGEVTVDWSHKKDVNEIDLVAIENGGKVIACNDMFFSSMHNLVMPGRGRDMGDGWETKRRRESGFDWVILALGHQGIIKQLEIDTAHFKGNYPDSCQIEGLHLPNATADQLTSNQFPWKIILPQTKLQADHQHIFKSEIKDIGKLTHLKMNIYPDGGISRLRAYGVLK